jgi:excinuclease UvrABC nuclease subunit
MTLREPELWQPPADLDRWLAALPQSPAVFLVHAAEGAPYLGRTGLLKRRLLRLLAPREHPSRLLNLRGLASRIEVWRTASTLEAALTAYTLARRHWPDTYARVLRLPKPPYVKLILSNPFPRTMVTTRLGGKSRYFGPFPSRAAADTFEKAFLDLFQIRRCQEDLEPSPDHPGCIYGEMRMCLRPCQDAVSPAEYASEVSRAADFLATGGASLAEAARQSRDRLSEQLRFEEAARGHAMLEKIQAVRKLPGELAHDTESLHGVAVTPSLEPRQVVLWFLTAGCWRDPRVFSLAPSSEGRPVPLDARLREIVSTLSFQPSLKDRQDHLAILARWHGSSWRDGEWIGFESPESVPYRRLVNAIHRVGAPATIA